MQFQWHIIQNDQNKSVWLIDQYERLSDCFANRCDFTLSKLIFWPRLFLEQMLPLCTPGHKTLTFSITTWWRTTLSKLMCPNLFHSQSKKAFLTKSIQPSIFESTHPLQGSGLFLHWTKGLRHPDSWTNAAFYLRCETRSLFGWSAYTDDQLFTKIIWLKMQTFSLSTCHRLTFPSSPAHLQLRQLSSTSPRL